MFDSHCHLTDEQFTGEVGAVLARARVAGVRGVVTVASDAADARRALHLAEAWQDVWSTAGVHPHVAAGAGAAERAAVLELLAQPRVVAVGEAGLDYFYDHSPRDVQRECFDWQLSLAAELDKPIIVHSREAEADTIAAIGNARGTRGILHCFSGGEALLRAGLDADWYISFAGTVTFKRFAAVNLVRAVPDDRLLIETDSPYLAPVPERGRRNEPALLRHTCETVARLRGVEPAVLGELVERNARACYRLADLSAD